MSAWPVKKPFRVILEGTSVNSGRVEIEISSTAPELILVGDKRVRATPVDARVIAQAVAELVLLCAQANERGAPT